jgi:hypothetical protein
MRRSIGPAGALDLTAKHGDFMAKQHQLQLNLGRGARLDADQVDVQSQQHIKGRDDHGREE